MTAPSSELIVNALPLPVLTVARGGAILQANAAAEAFFDLSLRVLQRQPLKDLLPFGSPVVGLVEEVRDRGASVSEYRIDVGSPRIGRERIVDVFATPRRPTPGRRAHAPGAHHRGQMDRQLTHRGAARSITPLCAMLAHEIKNPLSGIRGRGAATSSSRSGCRKTACSPGSSATRRTAS
jgi:two-component system nitrogen regulation sensor histidine kinase GlnL